MVAPPHTGTSEATGTSASRLPGQPREHWLRVAVACAAALVVLAAISLAVLSATRQQPTTTAPLSTTSVAPHHSGTSTVSPPRRAQRSRRTHHRARTRTGVPAGTAPVLSSLNPSTASAGQSVVISGTHFVSSNGTIVAQFDGQAAPTDCPQSTSCTVTVPAGSSATARVTVTTSAGTSNALTFTYQ
jgi:hypothetical protein